MGAAEHFRCVDPLHNRFSGVLRHFELHGSTGLALDHRDVFTDGTADHEVRDLQADEFAAPQFAVDGEVEEREIAGIAHEFEARANGLNLLRKQWALLAHKSPPVPGRALRFGNGKLDSGHDRASIRPSRPKRRHHVDAAPNRELVSALRDVAAF